MRMQYLVYSEGKVLDCKKKSYVINAKTESEAQETAKQEFLNENVVFDGQVYTKSVVRNKKAIVSYILMLVPVLLSFIPWKNGHETIYIHPYFISCIYAILFYVLYILRFKGFESVLKMTDSWIDLGFCFIIPFLFSTFIRILLVSEKISVLGFIDFQLDTSIVFPIAVVLSLLGIKIMSVLCMGAIFVLALFNIVNLNEAMGAVWGPVYAICAFAGILLYCSVEPAFREGISHFGGSLKLGMKHEAQDFIAASNSVREMGGAISHHVVEKKQIKKSGNDL